MASSKPKVQRKINSKRNRSSRGMRTILAKNLRSEYGIRTASLRKGDTVQVVRGDYKGHEGKVASIESSEGKVIVEGVNIAKMDGTNKPVLLSPSKLMITKLDLSDKMRKDSFESGKKGKEEKEKSEGAGKEKGEKAERKMKTKTKTEKGKGKEREKEKEKEKEKER